MAETPTTNKGAEETVFNQKPPEESIVKENAGVKGRKIEIDEEAMKQLLDRLNVLESDKEQRIIADEAIYNPLKEIKTERTLRMSFWNDKIVLGYEGKRNPDGTVRFINNLPVEKGEFKGTIRAFVTLIYADDKREQVDMIDFMRNLTPVVAKIKSQEDIGEVVEQGEVNRMAWNGRALIPTSTRIMTGYKNQVWKFIVEYEGKEYELSQDVVNLK